MHIHPSPPWLSPRVPRDECWALRACRCQPLAPTQGVPQRGSSLSCNVSPASPFHKHTSMLFPALPPSLHRPLQQNSKKKLSLLSVCFPKPFPPDECPLHHLSLPRLPMTSHIVMSSALILLTHQHLVCGPCTLPALLSHWLLLLSFLCWFSSSLSCDHAAPRAPAPKCLSLPSPRWPL